MSMTGEAAGIQPDTSSSSATNLELCFLCEKILDAEAVVCIDCKRRALCKTCNGPAHFSKLQSGHDQVNIDEYRMLNSGLGTSPVQDDQLDADGKNKLCYFCPIERRIVILLGRLAELVKDPKAQPSLVSFIGPTGVGKSTLLRWLLIKDGVRGDMDMPLPGPPLGVRSTSSDIHMYAGHQDSTNPLIYLDSEGRLGSEHPRGISRMMEGLKNLPGLDLNSYSDRRYGHVQSSYPRMLYIFSDVLCFVFSGSWREKSSIFDPVLEWGEQASFGADNQHRPQLIFIFNQVGEEGFMSEDFDDFGTVYKKWLGDDKRGKAILRYYSNPLVVVIPLLPKGAKKVTSRVVKLRQEITKSTERIRSERRESNLLFTRHQLQLYMRQAAAIFSKNIKDPFDIYKVVVADSTSDGVRGCIVTLRQELADALDLSVHMKYVLSLRVLRMRIKHCILLYISRNFRGPVAADSKLPRDLREALEAAEIEIDGVMPCGAVRAGVNCGTLKSKHPNCHSWSDVSKSTGHKDSGDFFPDPDVDEARKAFSLVYLAESDYRSASKFQDAKEILEWLLRDRRSERQENPWLKRFTSYRVCVICMLKHPTEMLSCGHIICDMCAQEADRYPDAQTRFPNKPISIECPVCLSSEASWHPRNLPALAGYRILSLDGGGVRGIVELLSLQAVMLYFPDMHVEDLFDIVVGTSTGGIIALALTVHKRDEEPKRLPDVVELFKGFARTIFSSDQQNWFAQNRLVQIAVEYLRKTHYPKYKNDALIGLLKEHLGEESLLLSCVGGPRVIITTCDVDFENAGAWFTSYNLAQGGDNQESSSTERDRRVPNSYIFGANEVAAATSAAPTYFPIFSAGNRRWTDGGVRLNGPPKIAMQEGAELWPKRPVSALLSLGCGDFVKVKRGDEKKAFGVVDFIQLAVKIAFDAEKQCQDALCSLRARQADHPTGPGIRLNPTISLPTMCELDDAKSVEVVIEETNTYLKSSPGEAVVHQAANLLFAALFHLHIPDVDIRDRKFHIRSCSALPQIMLNAIEGACRGSSLPFSVTVDKGASITVKWDACTWDHKYMDLPFSISGLPMRRPLPVMVNLHMCLPETKQPAKWPLPISGMPFTLEEYV